jgi:hypothetical protein
MATECSAFEFSPAGGCYLNRSPKIRALLNLPHKFFLKSVWIKLGTAEIEENFLPSRNLHSNVHHIRKRAACFYYIQMLTSDGKHLGHILKNRILSTYGQF